VSESRPLLIVNPKAGTGRAGQAFAEARRVIERELGEVDVVYTERPRHATELAREAAMAKRATVVAVGGDGSIHEVVSGLMQARDEGFAETRLGLLGLGTGGDFRKTFGFEHRLSAYVAALADGQTKRIDVGRFRCEHADDGSPVEGYFANILSLGMGGLVDRYVHRTSRWLGGSAGYFVASARSLLEYTPARFEVRYELDDGEKRELVKSRMIAVCNGQYFGSGMHVAPMADASDGVFEVVDLGAASRLRFALDSSAIYTAKHLQSADVRHFRCRKIRFEPLDDTRTYLDVDGEALGRLPLEVEVVPSALELFVPS
jgi:YegS/Rv2252/BmrU family lipid kinase